MQLTTAQIQLENLRAEGLCTTCASTSTRTPISEVINTPYHPAFLIEPTLFDLASTTALKYGLDTKLFTDVLMCESSMRINPPLSSTGDIGISQINPHFHPELSEAQMRDPVFSLDWMANEWKNNRAWQWTCWKSEEKNLNKKNS